MEDEIKFIERPSSRTHVIETRFHEILTREEAENIKAVADKANLKPVVFMKSIDKTTFGPIIYFFMVAEGQQLGESLKYVAKLENIADLEVLKL